MPTVMCDSCGHLVRWSNFRGSEKPKICTVPACTGKMVAVAFVGGEYRVASPSGRKGRRKVACALCGKMRMVPSPNVRYLTPGNRIADYARAFYGDKKADMLTADDPLCWTHVEKDCP